ncbi:MAG: asparagine synthetase B [Candidatus Bathyarchaeota archaeon]|nr:asparagine synthetase B [Candidatus Bathyarchaeota archaeon]
MKVTVAVLSKEGESVIESVLDVLRSVDVGQPLHLGLMTPKRGMFDKNPALLSKQSAESTVAAGFACTQARTTAGYDHLQLEDASVLFEGRVYAPIPPAAVSEQLSKEPQHCETLLETLISQADGDYAFWLLKEGAIAAARDPVGVQPLYYGENQTIAAYATNRRVLWELGIENPLSFPPGSLGVAEKTGFKFKPIKTLTFNEPQQVTLDDAAVRLQMLVEESLKRRTRGLKEAAVAFSGGLDSSVVAFLANKLGVKVQLLHVSMENEPETEEAIDAAEALDLPMQIHLFKDSDVEKTLPHVVELIEEPDPIKAAIGVPFYWTAQQAAEAGFKVVLAGQGADELFGGYQRYVNEYCKDGAEAVRKTMFGDVVNIHQSNLERDLKITSYFDVELRLPFGCYDVAEYALSLPLSCKIEPKPDTLRKLVLRKVASNLGMPPSVADKPKKAVQYSTGINNSIKRIAREHNKTVGEYIGELFHNQKAA